ncbi:unnamed protein product (macronuclear) [Paramecium tetraurelia]|uniref:B30.2/SPRY domain-containing protein n=1 Tax=Paramecium tetraurelia TaxID=5888 RepID=A0DB79_PARTE|nr:uncharacterized protein GSPATT00015190001 [Paramecium tetraurelia]CAK80296.1 unnamed protein product [Paramecium tetraurelia]|eukprot:XP_001447693.1 hypothetical protein (macronuclear) [Paramecium tetraurelia strain d4-2]
MDLDLKVPLVIRYEDCYFKEFTPDQNLEGQFNQDWRMHQEWAVLRCKLNAPPKQAFSDNEEGWAIYNGELRHNSNSTGNKYGKQYKKGDIIGVMLNMIDGQLSFSINGENQGIAFECNELKEVPLYAAIAPIYKEDGIELLMAVRED